MKKSMIIIVGAVLAFSASAYQSWSGNAGNGVLSDNGNWSNGESPVYNDGGDSNLGGFPSGTYTLNADMTANRIIFDQSGTEAVFDLGAHTLTLVGQEQIAIGWAFGAVAAGSTLRLASGTISVPWNPQPGEHTNCYFHLTRQQDSTNFNFIVDGPSSHLTVGKLNLTLGYHNTLVITNGGKCTATDLGFALRTNVVVVTGSGSKLTATTLNLNGGTDNRLEVRDGAEATVTIPQLGSATCEGATVIVSGEGSVFKRNSAGSIPIGGSIWAKDCRLEVLAGGTIQNFNNITLGSGNNTSAGWGHVLAFRGAKTDVSLPQMQNKLIIGQGTADTDNAAYNCRLEVTDGATLWMTNGASAGNNRAWIAPQKGAHHNEILVSGAGSRLISNANAAWLIGQHGYNNALLIADGAYMQSANGITVGQGDSATSKANGNALVVDGGALVLGAGITVGYGTLGEAASNRLEVLSGGVITNTAGVFRLGASTNAHYCTARLSDGRVYTSGDANFGLLGHHCRMTIENYSVFSNLTSNIRIGIDSAGGSCSNLVEVLSGSSVYTEGFFRVCGVGSALTVSNGTIICKGTLQLPFDSSTAADPVITIAGERTHLKSTGDILWIGRNATLNFVVPKEGYEGTIFKSAPNKNLTITNLNAVNWDIPKSISTDNNRFVLAEAGEGGTLLIDDTTLTTMRANLPNNCRLAVRENRLVLTVGRIFMILFR